MRGILATSTLAALLASCHDGAHARADASLSRPSKVAHADYSNPALWLCRPGLADDKCKINLDATVIQGDGKTTIEKFKAASRSARSTASSSIPPSRSTRAGQSDFDGRQDGDRRRQAAVRALRLGVPPVRADLSPDHADRAARRERRSRRRRVSVCRPGVGGYNDVVDAWNWYMANENKGRGVVLIGHSQGAGVIARLIARRSKASRLRSSSSPASFSARP